MVTFEKSFEINARFSNCDNNVLKRDLFALEKMVGLLKSTHHSGFGLCYLPEFEDESHMNYRTLLGYELPKNVAQDSLTPKYLDSGLSICPSFDDLISLFQTSRDIAESNLQLGRIDDNLRPITKIGYKIGNHLNSRNDMVQGFLEFELTKPLESSPNDYQIKATGENFSEKYQTLSELGFKRN